MAAIDYDDAMESVTRGATQFAVNLYRAAESGQPGNLVVSPLSVQIVLALAYSGARGATADELKTLLSLPDSIDITFTGYQGLLKILNTPVLKLANRIFVEKTSGVKDEFQNNAKQYFYSPAEAVDFRSDFEKSRRLINSWVENQTEKKITELLRPGTINGETKLVLVNALYFKDGWLVKFRQEDTKKEQFRVSKSKTVPVEMMHADKKFHFAHDDELKAKILQLDYVDNFHMIVILPDDIEGLKAVEDGLQRVDLSGKIKRMKHKPAVKVALPKFKLEKTTELNDALKALGAKSMFAPGKADFSGLSKDSLVVSKVVQKVFIDVDEEGTEAAAATADHFLLTGMPPPKKPHPDQEFIADHPFLFFITSQFFNAPLFIGRYIAPD